MVKKELKIVTVIGARPQFVKAAVVSRAIRAHNADATHELHSPACGIQHLMPITEVIVHTGQHFDHGMSQVFFDEMEIPEPDYNLGINGLSHGAMTGQMLEQIEKVFIDEEPDLDFKQDHVNRKGHTMYQYIAEERWDMFTTHDDVLSGIRLMEKLSY